MEQQIGKITHYFDKISVGVIEVTDGILSVGDTIKVATGGEEFTQAVASLQIDRQDVSAAAKGQSVGIKVDRPVKPGDLVYKI